MLIKRILNCLKMVTVLLLIVIGVSFVFFLKDKNPVTLCEPQEKQSEMHGAESPSGKAAEETECVAKAEPVAVVEEQQEEACVETEAVYVETESLYQEAAEEPVFEEEEPQTEYSEPETEPQTEYSEPETELQTEYSEPETELQTEETGTEAAETETDSLYLESEEESASEEEESQTKESESEAADAETELLTETETESESGEKTSETKSGEETADQKQSEKTAADEKNKTKKDETLHTAENASELKIDIPEFYIDSTKYPAANVNQNTIDIYNYLVQNIGLNHAAACGVLANIHLESDFNPMALGDGGTSYGICQWHNERFRSLVYYCIENGKDYNTVYGQLGYLESELLGGYYSVFDYLRNVPDTEEGAYNAAAYWCKFFENPDHREERADQRGNLAMNEYYIRQYERDTDGLDAQTFCRSLYSHYRKLLLTKRLIQSGNVFLTEKGNQMKHGS